MSQYECNTQAMAQKHCEMAGGTLCSIHEVETLIGQNCAYMWTSSSSTLGYHVQSAHCGTAGKVVSETKSWKGVGKFEAGCCPKAHLLEIGAHSPR
jgi:hypothetical protein